MPFMLPKLGPRNPTKFQGTIFMQNDAKRCKSINFNRKLGSHTKCESFWRFWANWLLRMVLIQNLRRFGFLGGGD